jgi:hypothetical protein
VNAVGLYLRLLIEGQPGLTIRQVCARAGVGDNYIWRIENKGADVPVLVLKSMIELTGGSWDHVVNLLNSTKDEAVSYAVASQFAADCLAKQPSLPHRDARIKESEDLTTRLIDHPRAFDKWLGYGACLIDNLIGTE